MKIICYGRNKYPKNFFRHRKKFIKMMFGKVSMRKFINKELKYWI